MLRTLRSRLIFWIVALSLLALLICQPAPGAQAAINSTCYSQSGGGNWSYSWIWNSCNNAFPSGGDTAVIYGTDIVNADGTVRYINDLHLIGTLNLVYPAFQLNNNLYWCAGGTVGGSGTFNAGGNSADLCLYNPALFGPSIVVNTESPTFINCTNGITAGSLGVSVGAFNLGGPGTFTSGVNVYNGGTLNLNSDLSNGGIWIQNGIFNPNTYKVTFNGAGSQYIAGNNASNFYKLAVGGSSTLFLAYATTIANDIDIASGGNLALANHLSMGGNLTNAGTLTHNNKTVTFSKAGTQTITGNTGFYSLSIGGGTTLNTASVVTVSNSLTRTAGSVTNETRAISASGSQAFGLSDATVNLTTQGTLSSLVVSRTDTAHTSAPAAAGKLKFLPRYTTFAPSGSGFTANMCFKYTDSEISGMTEDNLHLCRWTGTGWSCPARGAGSAPSTNTVCADGVTQFSDWTIAESSPGILGGSGPGGWGIADAPGTSNLTLWLKSGTGVYSDSGCTTAAINGGSVGCWKDQSGNNNNATQTDSNLQPFYNTTGVNGQPELHFDGSNDKMALVSQPIIPGATYNVYAIALKDGGSSLDPVYATWNSSGLWFSLGTNGANVSSFSNGSVNGVTAVPTGSYHGFQYMGSGNNVYVYLDGTLENSGAVTTPETAAPYIGGSTSSFYWDGRFDEIIMLNDINNVDRTLMESYLHAKYGIASGVNQYSGYAAAYINDVAGIGYFSSYNRQARSGGLVLWDAGFLQNDNQDYLLVGHNNGTGETNLNLPTSGNGWEAGTGKRWQRSWYVDNTDGGTAGGMVNLTFDFSEAGRSQPGGDPTNYRLLRRDGTSGTFAQVAQAIVISGDQVTFSVNAAALTDGYYTLGTIDGVDSPTAVTITDFTSHTAWGASGVNLSWSTVMEFDTLGYYLERAERSGEPFVRITPELIPVLYPGQMMGGYYTFTDTSAEASKSYVYRLIEVSSQGVTQFRGTLTYNPFWEFIPIIWH